MRDGSEHGVSHVHVRFFDSCARQENVEFSSQQLDASRAARCGGGPTSDLYPTISARQVLWQDDDCESSGVSDAAASGSSADALCEAISKHYR